MTHLPFIATLGAMRKNNEVPKERRQIPSAREMSRLKHEKQLKLEEQTRIARMNYQQGVRIHCSHKLELH